MEEIQLVKCVFKILLKKDPNSRISNEVPILGRYADLALIKRKRIITIECKLYNWRRALDQTIDHKLGADYSYICMPQKNISDRMISEIRKFGIGLYSYCHKTSLFKELVKPIKSNEIYTNAWLNTYNYIMNNSSKTIARKNAF